MPYRARRRGYVAVMPTPPRKSDARELVEATTAGAIGSVPVVGGVAAGLFTFLVTFGYNRRLQEWMDEISADVQHLLDEQGLTMEDLAEDEAFLDAVIDATRVATATSRREKWEWLRNGLRGALGDQDLDEQHRFFRLVDELTPPHVRILTYVRDPVGSLTAQGLVIPTGATTPRDQLMRLPEFAQQRDDWLDLLESDLVRSGLMKELGGKVMVSANGALSPRLTGLGRRFLRFIESHED